MTDEELQQLQALIRKAMAADLDRKVYLLGTGAEDLVYGRMPSPSARVLIGVTMLAWLESGQGRSLERDYLRVIKPKSHRTPQKRWEEIRSSSGMTATKLLSDVHTVRTTSADEKDDRT